MTYDYDRTASSDGWDQADELYFDDAESSVDEDLREIGRYIKRCRVLIEPYKKLAEALEAPKLKVYAERIAGRVQDLEQMTELLREGRPLIEPFADAFEELAHNAAKGSRSELQSLPLYRRIKQVGEKLEVISDRILKQDEGEYIDWTLDGYIGDEAGIYRRIERVSPGTFDSVNVLADRIFYGLLKYYSDPDYLQNRIEEIQAEAD